MKGGWDKQNHWHCSLKQMCHFARKTNLVNKGQNMLHKLSLDASDMAISYWQEKE